MENTKKEQTIDLMELLYRFRRYWVIIALCGLLAAGAAFVYTQVLITPLYQSTCGLIVITRVEANDNVTQDQLNSAETIAATYREILLGNGFLSFVKNKLSATDSGLSVATLQGEVSISTKTGTQLMTVAVRDPDPKRAARIANVIYNEAPDYVKEKAEIGAIKSIEPVQTSKNSVYPSWKRNTAIGFLIGVLIPMAVIALMMVFENTYKTDTDVKQDLDLPVLGVIPSMDFSKIAAENEKGGAKDEK